jgi:polyhydroxyalkanoate synthase
MMGGAAEQAGSWWPHWKEWLVARSGPTKKAPTKLGAANHPPGDAAPGAYAFEDGKPKRTRKKAN